MATIAAGSSRPALLAEAAAHEEKYEWREAANCYDRLTQDSPESPTESAVDIALRAARCHELASHQASDIESFRLEIEAARSIYLRLEERELGPSGPSSLSHRIAKVGRLHIESGLIREGRERRRLLDEALAIHRTILEDMESKEGKIPLRLGNLHLWLLAERRSIDPGESIPALLKEGLSLGEKLTSPSSLSSSSDDDGPNGNDNDDEFAEAYAHLLYFAFLASRFFDDWARDPGRRTVLLERMPERLSRVNDSRALAWLSMAIAQNVFKLRGQEEAAEHFSRGLAAARVSRDLRRIYMLSAGTIHAITLWGMLAERDGERAELRLQEIVSSLEGAKRELSNMPDIWACFWLVSHYRMAVQAHYEYAKNFVTNLEERRRQAERSVELFREGLPLAELTDVHTKVGLTQIATEAFRYLASLEPDGGRRQALLLEAVSIAGRASTSISRREPVATPWYQGELIVQEGMIRYDLAREIADTPKKQEMLQLAIARFREGLERAVLGQHEFPEGTHTSLGSYLLNYARALGELFELTNDPTLIVDQLKALDEAANSFSKAERLPRLAEARWQKAKTFGRVGQHRDASQEFRISSEVYERAALSAPSLSGLYGDLSRYMIGWSRIEEARAAHRTGLYQDASRAYRGAVRIFCSTERWSPLGELYLAHSIMEKAEASSYEEDSESAFHLFARAANSFAVSHATSNSWDSQVLGEGGEDEVLRWKEVAIERERYCRARAEMEDAKLLNRKGDHGRSARRFAVAKTLLESLAEGDERETNRELSTLALVCAAWEAIEEAEATSSSERYADAARIFGQAADLAASEKIALLVKGHAAYCDAIRLSTELRSKRDPTVYRRTKEFLEVAIDSYTRAGVQRGALWARGTEHLLDGLIYSEQAESELVIKVKTQLYVLSERSFEAAAKLYREAKLKGKQDQANQYLKVVRQKRRIFASPVDALDTTFVVRGAPMKTSLTFTLDHPAAGLERFEGANIQGRITADRTEVVMGDSMEVLLELVGIGRVAAVVAKITEIESKDIDTEVVGGKYKVEDGAISFRSLRIDPFETFTLALRMKPRRQGEFAIRPRVLFVDERGKLREFLTNRMTFKVVSAIGPTPYDSTLDFNEPRAHAVFEYLLSAFVDDCMVNSLYWEQAGWRSISQVAKANRIHYSSLYGRQGRYGAPVDELVARGLVGVRVFRGHRGRGGEAIKLRIAYEKEPVKRYVDRRISKPKQG